MHQITVLTMTITMLIMIMNNNNSATTSNNSDSNGNLKAYINKEQMNDQERILIHESNIKTYTHHTSMTIIVIMTIMTIRPTEITMLITTTIQ